MDTNKACLLTIVIPQHSENELIIGHLLSSLNIQIGIDFKTIMVIIVGDGGYKLDTNFLKTFESLSIRYVYYLPAHGPGYARQKGLDLADSRYIAYLDGDDILNTVNALWKFTDVIQRAGNHEVIFSRYIEEYSPDSKGRNQFKIREFNPSAAYGKWIDVNYIRQHKFRWHPLLTYAYEDTFFLDEIITFSTDIYYLDSPTYTWLYHSNSIVRSTIDYNRNHLNEYIRENRLWALEIKKRAPQRLHFDVNNGLVNIYHFAKEHPPVQAIVKKVMDELNTYLIENQEDIDLDYSTELLHSNYPDEDSSKFRLQLTTALQRSLFTNRTIPTPRHINTKLLSIIIPFSGESIKIVSPLLSSIMNQVAFDLSQVMLSALVLPAQLVSNTLLENL